MKKTLILLAALAFATAGPSFAQTATPSAAISKMKVKDKKEPKTPAQKADRGAAKMAKELGLNADQEARIEQIMLARDQEKKALKAKYGDNKKAAHADMKASNDRFAAQFKEVLTAEQYAKFMQMKDDHKGHGPKGHAKGEGKTKIKAKG